VATDGLRERLDPVKTALTVAGAVLAYIVGVVELIEGGHGAEPFLYLGVGAVFTVLSVRRVRAVREWRQSRSRR
jgi:hypothetical protein